MANAERERAARFPYFPFYVDDWLSSNAIAGFTLEQEAVYLRLLLRQWTSKDCMLTKDETKLANFSRLGPRWAKVGRPVLKRCFEKRANGFVNVRLREEWVWVQAKTKQAKRAARSRWNGDGDAE